MIFFLENENASYTQFHHIRKLLLTFLDICILRFMAGPWRVHWVLLLSFIKEKHLTDGQQVKKKHQTISKNYHRPRICPLPACGAVVKRLSNHLLESHNMEKDVFYYSCLKSAVIYSP